MNELDLKQLRIQGENLKREANKLLEINFSPFAEDGEGSNSLPPLDLAEPTDDARISSLPAAIRGAKRFLASLVSLELEEQTVEVGLVYAWSGLENQWVKALSKHAKIEALGLAVAPSRIQFWGIANVKGINASQKIYLSASQAGHIVVNPTRHLLGVGVAKNTVFLDTLRGLLK